jgi:uncharacterized protein
MERTLQLDNKLNKLKNILGNMDSALIAYSGGVDSTFLLKVAYDVMGEKVLAVTANSEVQSENEIKEASDIIADIGARYLVIETNEMQDENYKANAIDRCYHCKKILFSDLIKVAEEQNIDFILEGSNADDLSDYRPGLKAIEELKIRSPLKEADLTKDEIRSLSKSMGLPTWNKPAFACLASRIPYGTEITNDKLRRVDKAEFYLRSLGFYQVRVRDHGDIARIEVLSSEFEKLFSNGLIEEITANFKEIGYLYVTLDLEGYKTGSMNKVIDLNG